MAVRVNQDSQDSFAELVCARRKRPIIAVGSIYVVIYSYLNLLQPLSQVRDKLKCHNNLLFVPVQTQTLKKKDR